MKNKIEIKMKSGTCEAYEVTPFHEAKYPPVLMYMDAIGVRDSLLDLAQQIADKGFTVLVPNLFYRSHSLPVFPYPEGKIDAKLLSEKLFPTISPFMKALTPELLIQDAEFYLNHLLAHPRVRGSHAGIVGYCFGAGHAVRTAAKYPDKVGVVVGLHGGNLASDDEKSTLPYLEAVKASLYFGHADHDKSMPLPAIHVLEAECKRLGKDFESVIYTGAHHGFTQSDLPAYEPEAAEKSFQATIKEFKKLKT